MSERGAALLMRSSTTSVNRLDDSQGAQPMVELDDISESFFDEGRRQEAIGLYHESPEPYRGSLTRIARNRWHSVLLMTVLLSLGAGAAWVTGWQPPPEWGLSSLWQAAGELVD